MKAFTVDDSGNSHDEVTDTVLVEAETDGTFTITCVDNAFSETCTSANLNRRTVESLISNLQEMLGGGK